MYCKEKPNKNTSSDFINDGRLYFNMLNLIIFKVYQIMPKIPIISNISGIKKIIVGI